MERRDPGDVAERDELTAAEVDLPFRVAKQQAIARWERRYIGELLRRHGGNISASARAAQMDRNYLRELLTRHRFALGER